MHSHGPLWFWSRLKRLHCSVFDGVRHQQSMHRLGLESPEKTYPTFGQACCCKELEMIENAQKNDSKVWEMGELSMWKQHLRCQQNSHILCTKIKEFCQALFTITVWELNPGTDHTAGVNLSF